jgi:transcription termination factor Rho
MPDAKSVDGPARPVLRRRIIRKAGDTPPVPAPHHPAPLPSARLSPAAPPAPAPVPPPEPPAPAPAAEQAAPTPPARPERPPPRPGSRLDDLYRMPMPQLFKLAETYGMHEHTGMTRVQLIVGIVRRQIERGDKVTGSGTLEVLPDGYGFLRSQAHNYLASPEDIYVSPSQIRRMSLRTGYVVEGPIRLPIENQDNFALMQIELVNGRPADEAYAITGFGDLTPLHPNKRFILEAAPDDMSMRIVDLITPIGKGQRGLIVAPPRTGKTVLLAKMANSIIKNHPEAYVFVLLVDERPEEVTEMQKMVVGSNAEVVASTFDEPPEEHIHVADIVLEKAKRLVEMKRDVVILLDSITRLARAYNTEAGPGGKLLSGGLDSNAMQKPKQFFGAARNVEEGGSLTILATALIDTNSRMDEVIFEEFKGTGNSELYLDRRLVEKRVYPAIDVNRSGTRKEELLLHPDEADKIRILRRVLADMHPVEAMELLVNRSKKTKSNAEFLMSMNLA